MLKPSRLATLAVLVAAAMLAAAGPIADAKRAKSSKVTVMTRNLYLGTDLIPIATADPGAPAEKAAGDAFREATVTNQPKQRMILVAEEIAKTHPDVVGLQELSIWRTGPKNDPAKAKHVVVDYLKQIKRRLKILKAPYKVVTVRRQFDIEGPADNGKDVRLTLGNAILVRTNRVKVGKHRSADFKTTTAIPTKSLGTVHIKRGFDEADLNVRGAKFHFVNTHLEAYSPTSRDAQAKELLNKALQKRKGRAILVGDLNSGPNLGDTDLDNANELAYKRIAKAGFKPRRTKKNSCCFNEDLRSGKWDHNIDWIMSRPKVGLIRSFLVGRKKTGLGAYTSDHGGVVSVLKLRR